MNKKKIKNKINLNRSTWKKQFKIAIKKYGADKSMWDNTLSKQEEKEWTWPGFE